jgi:hypothetical protein
MLSSCSTAPAVRAPESPRIALYQRHEFLAEREQALDIWGAHVGKLLKYADARTELRIVA